MKKLVSTLNLGKKEWLKYRKGGIGGSDAGAICGLNPYRTAIQVYNDKRTDEIEEFDNEAMREGRDLEEYVARRFMETTGKKVRRANAMFYDEENPFMLADVDRMIVGENARENDLGVNITTAKQMTNVRSATKDQTAVIKTPRILTLEESLEFLDDDEYMEVTPESIRLRKQILNKAERDKANKRKKKAAEAE